MQEELQEELAQELASYNIDPFVEGITDEQYSSVMSQLALRREAQLAGKTPEEQRRVHAMRNNMLWHLHTVSLPGLPPLTVSEFVWLSNLCFGFCWERLGPSKHS